MPDEETLFGAPGADKAVTKSRSTQSRRRAEASVPVPCTPEGKNAGDLIGAWIDWYQGITDVPIPHQVTSRLSRHVKELIVSGYTANDIKFGLAIWTVNAMDNPRLPPNALTQYTWHWATKTRGNGNRFREEVSARIAELSGGTVTASDSSRGRSQRVQATANAFDEWAQKRNQGAPG